MKKIIITVVLCAFFAVLSVSADPGLAGSVGDAASLLGMDLRTAFERFGVPARVSSVRGDESWQDDVVFSYGGGLSLFWFRDRVWQIRLDKTFSESVFGLAMGDTRGKVEEVFGRPLSAQDDWILYHFAGEAFPVRVRMFFSEGGLEDIYVFRGDF